MKKSQAKKLLWYSLLALIVVLLLAGAQLYLQHRAVLFEASKRANVTATEEGKVFTNDRTGIRLVYPGDLVYYDRGVWTIPRYLDSLEPTRHCSDCRIPEIELYVAPTPFGLDQFIRTDNVVPTDVNLESFLRERGAVLREESRYELPTTILVNQGGTVTYYVNAQDDVVVLRANDPAFEPILQQMIQTITLPTSE